MGLTHGEKEMTKSKLLSAALIAAATLATPAMARTNYVTARVIVHPSHQVEAISSERYKRPGYAPIHRQQNRNLDPSNYGGELPPNGP
jgi:hypothetical protein